MTHIYCVRHAQPDDRWQDDKTRPLTALGMADTPRVTEALSGIAIDAFFASSYRRSVDTIRHCADARGMTIHTDERFRERKQGIKSEISLEDRWNDFSLCEEQGENLASVQARNIEALKELLRDYAGKTLVLGTHGTALSTILNYFDPSCGANYFRKIWFCMPYIIRLDFDGAVLKSREELLSLERGY